MAFDFRNLVSKYSKSITVEEETGGYFDHEDGGKWKPATKTWETMASVFNLSAQDIRGYAIQYGEGGSFTREDIRIYIHEDLTIGARVTYKSNTYTVSSAIDHSDHAYGLRLYIARKVKKREFMQSSPKGEEDTEVDNDGHGEY